MTQLELFCKKNNACEDGMEYIHGMEVAEFWEKCHRGDWMMWLAGKLGVDERLMYLIKGHQANTVRHLMTDERSTKAIDAAIAYGEGKITKEELSYAAAAASAASAAAFAASAAAYYAASAYYAAYAASAAYAAAAYAAAAKLKNQQETADICRKYITVEMIVECFNKANP